MIKVVGFDLDNTLYNQSSFEYEVFERISSKVAEYLNIDKNEYLKALITLYNNKERNYVFDKALINLNYKLPKQWEQFVKKNILPLYRSFIPKNIILNSNIKNILTNLKNKNYRLVLITNGNSNIQNNKINALNLRIYFDLILISDDFEPKRRKPDTYMFKYALKYFNIRSDEMIYVGDDLILDKASELVGIKFIHINEFDLQKLLSSQDHKKCV